MDVFTDGACVNNGRKNARASWAAVFPENPELDVSGLLLEGEQTNNRAEFTAAIRALEQTPGLILHVYTDSLLLVKIARGEWSAKKNLDLVNRIKELSRGRQVDWTHVRAHTGKTDRNSKWNAVADHQAEGLLKIVGL